MGENQYSSSEDPKKLKNKSQPKVAFRKILEHRLTKTFQDLLSQREKKMNKNAIIRSIHSMLVNLIIRPET